MRHPGLVVGGPYGLARNEYEVAVATTKDLPERFTHQKEAKNYHDLLGGETGKINVGEPQRFPVKTLKHMDPPMPPASAEKIANLKAEISERRCCDCYHVLNSCVPRQEHWWRLPHT